MKSFVASPEAMQAIGKVIARPRFVNGEMLSVTAGVDPAWLREVIPAPLEPNGDSIRFMVGRWQSNCVDNFAGAGIYVPARLGDLSGEYVLAMYMDNDASILFGREVFGEPKKQATSQLRRASGRAAAWVERYGQRILHLEAELDEETGPVDDKGINFNIKAMAATDGQGLESDAIVTAADFDVHFTATAAGRGAVALRSNGHDPLDSIPLGEVRGAVWQEGDLLARARRVATIPAKDFAPYYYARIDDYAGLNTEDRQLL